MIINTETIFKKIIFSLIKKNYNIKLRKKEMDMILFKDKTIKENYDEIVKMLIKNKRIKRKNIAYTLWVALRKRLGI